METHRTVWLTRGRRAGTFETFPTQRADAIIAARMGQDVAGLAMHNLDPAEVSREDYPLEIPAGEPVRPAPPEAVVAPAAPIAATLIYDEPQVAAPPAPEPPAAPAQRMDGEDLPKPVPAPEPVRKAPAAPKAARRPKEERPKRTYNRRDLRAEG